MGRVPQHPKIWVFWARETVKQIFLHEHLGFSEAMLWPFLGPLMLMGMTESCARLLRGFKIGNAFCSSLKNEL